MIEENKINKNKTIDALPIPEDAVILKSKKNPWFKSIGFIGNKGNNKAKRN